MILSCVVLTQYSSVADRRTDGQKDVSAVAKTRLALHAVARKNCPKGAKQAPTTRRCSRRGTSRGLGSWERERRKLLQRQKWILSICSPRKSVCVTKAYGAKKIPGLLPSRRCDLLWNDWGMRPSYLERESFCSLHVRRTWPCLYRCLWAPLRCSRTCLRLTSFLT